MHRKSFTGSSSARGSLRSVPKSLSRKVELASQVRPRRHSGFVSGTSQYRSEDGRTRNAEPQRGGTVHHLAPPEEEIVVAICENSARDIGIAHLNLASAHILSVSQFQDGATYSKVLSILLTLQPTEIIACDTQRKRLLFQALQTAVTSPSHRDADSPQWLRGLYFPKTKLQFVRRNFFNGHEGVHLLSTHLSSWAKTGLKREEIHEKYWAMCSVSALLTHVQQVEGVGLESKCLVGKWCHEDGHVLMDLQTLRDLEILYDKRYGRVECSLLGLIDHTRTIVGGRMMRSTLASPLNDLESITARLDAVEELSTKREVFFAVDAGLGTLLDLDYIVGTLSLVPTTLTKVRIIQGLRSLIGMRHTLTVSLARLTSALEQCSTPLLAVRHVHPESHGFSSF